MGQNLSSLDNKIQKYFLDITEKLSESKSFKARDMAYEYWKLFKEGSLKPVQMGDLLIAIDKGGFDSFLFNEKYIECRFLVIRLTEYLINYETLKSQTQYV